jgi:hypothetical protein
MLLQNIKSTFDFLTLDRSMTFQDIAKYRLVNQQLTSTKIKSAIKLVEWFGAVQGQEYAQSKWGLGLRLPHVVDDDIEKDLNDGKILRTHLLRPTWHFVSARDIHWLLKLTAPRVHAANAYMYRQLELDTKLLNRCNEIMVAMLAGGNHCTRDRINEEFERNKIIAQGHRLSYIMMNAELEGIICSGKRQGNQSTYALLDERIKRSDTWDKDEALAELTTRYFKSRNPATIKDFSTWSGLTISDCKKGIEMIQSLLRKTEIEKQEFHFNPAISLPDRLDKIYLLPIYDEFIIGYKDRTMIMTLRKDVPLRYDSMVVWDGQIIGTWKRTIGKMAVQLEVDFFKPLSRAQRNAFGDAVNRLSKFVGLEVTPFMT